MHTPKPRRDRLEVFPARLHIVPGLPLFLRPHFVRKISANGADTLWHSQGYATRGGAVRAARKAARPEGLWVHVLDDSTPQPRTIRTYPPRGTR